MFHRRKGCSHGVQLEIVGLAGTGMEFSFPSDATYRHEKHRGGARELISYASIVVGWWEWEPGWKVVSQT